MAPAVLLKDMTLSTTHGNRMMKSEMALTPPVAWDMQTNHWVKDFHINEDSAASLDTTFNARGNRSIMMDRRPFNTIEEGSVRERVKSANQT